MSAIDMTLLRATLGGSIHEPGDPGYEEACTLFNAAVTRRPRLVVRCASVPDVVVAVRYARDTGMPLAVRAGGHSAAGRSLCDDGLVIDVRALDQVDVDVGARTVTVGGGALTGAVDRALCEHGRATVTGRVSTTGLAGFTLGGGSGVLERRFGFAVDNLLGAQIVTADGDVLRVDDSNHADLFWALRGGGGNFGVVTELTFRTHKVGPVVTGGLLIWPEASRAAVTRHFRDYMAQAPEHVGGYLAFLYGPDDPSIPPGLRNEPVVAAYVCHSGPLALAESELGPLRAYGPPAVDWIEQVRFADFQCAMDDPPGYRNYMTSEHLASLDDAVIGEIVRHARALPRGPGWILLVPWGGAVSRSRADTPIGSRETEWVVHPAAFWEDPVRDDEAAAWVTQLRSSLAPFASGGVWLNWIGDEGEARIQAAFGDAAYARLRAVKAAYDPGNLFRSNHNIEPAPKEDCVQDPGYPEDAVGRLGAIWGEGFLSPGGPAEVGRVLGHFDLSGASVLDIGSGAGGVDAVLATTHGAASVLGIDVEERLVAAATDYVSRLGLSDRVVFRLVEPGILPFADGAFDVVFSKDALIHVADKQAVYAEAYRVLVAGGRLAVSDWLRSGEPGLAPLVARFVDASGHAFSLATLEQCGEIVARAGFVEIELEDRTVWYRGEARAELERLRGPLYERFVRQWGEDATLEEIGFWEVLVDALEAGALRPGHIRARKP